MSASIPFIDLQAQKQRLDGRIEAAIARVLDHGRFIHGPEVAEFEGQLATFTGVKNVVGCGNGTDALQLALRALNAGPDDAIFVPAFTFAATAEVVCLVGATPVFVDVEAGNFNMDPASLREAIAMVRADGALNPVGIIPVDLFGLTAPYDEIAAIADSEDLWVLSDAAQSMGASHDGAKAGSFGNIAATSFFPAKPLGCYGDGGAVLTDNDDLAAAIRSMRMHGQGRDKYDNVVIGTNSRLDTVQAAILIEKLSILADEIEARQVVAARYADALGNSVTVPRTSEGTVSAWAQYTLRVPDRAAVQAALSAAGIPTAVYYPSPLPRLTAYKDFPVAPGGIPVADALSTDVLSLPMHPYLDAATQDRIVAALRDAVL